MVHDLTQTALDILFGHELEYIIYGMNHKPDDINVYDNWVVSPLSRCNEVKSQMHESIEVSWMADFNFTPLYENTKRYFSLFRIIENPNIQPSDRPQGI
jgi:hypothetical protein